MKLCPRCKRYCLEDESVLNSISHIGKEIEICSVCGTSQGMVGMGYSTDIVEIEMENRFRNELKNLKTEKKSK